ncbi:hypothetical protein [Endozoicomonas sp. 2B-B]
MVPETEVDYHLYRNASCIEHITFWWVCLGWGKALPEPNSKMGIFLFPGAECINGQ